MIVILLTHRFMCIHLCALLCEQVELFRICAIKVWPPKWLVCSEKWCVSQAIRVSYFRFVLWLFAAKVAQSNRQLMFSYNCMCNFNVLNGYVYENEFLIVHLRIDYNIFVMLLYSFMSVVIRLNTRLKISDDDTSIWLPTRLAC